MNFHGNNNDIFCQEPVNNLFHNQFNSKLNTNNQKFRTL